MTYVHTFMEQFKNLLHSYGGEVPQMTTYLAQLKQIGAFEQVKGILLGTFTKMEENKCQPDIVTLVKEFELFV